MLTEDSDIFHSYIPEGVFYGKAQLDDTVEKIIRKRPYPERDLSWEPEWRMQHVLYDFEFTGNRKRFDS